ncbi:MAG: hypothetical protein N4A72_06190 [Bacteroidales bacterium]|jgi:hypothetical protein|nr:hypothetical protein [Bacteroidales bacterium]
MKESRAFYDQETHSAIGIFKGFLTSDKFKKIAEELHDIRKENDSCKQLNNIEDMKVLSQDVQTWLNDVWFPKAKTTGLKYFAFVVPKDIFGKVSMESANSDEQTTNGIEIKYFDNETDAKNWLKSK